MQAERVELFLKDFTSWASAQADILAVALVGSFARNAGTDSSDLDLVILMKLRLKPTSESRIGRRHFT